MRIAFIPGLTLTKKGSGIEPEFIDGVKSRFGFEIRNYVITAFDDIQAHSKRFVEQWRADVLQTPNEQWIFFGHSMGGLVMRYSLNHLLTAEERNLVKAAVSFATPHLGTPLASGKLPEKHPAVAQMTEAAVCLWNCPTRTATYSPEVPGIICGSVQSYFSSAADAWEFNWEGIKNFLGYRAIAKALAKKGRPPENDGVVPKDAQTWGQLFKSVNVPHEWFPNGGNAKRGDLVKFYGDLINELVVRITESRFAA